MTLWNLQTTHWTSCSANKRTQLRIVSILPRAECDSFPYQNFDLSISCDRPCLKLQNASHNVRRSHAFKSLHVIADNSLKNNFQVSGADPGKMKRGASRKGQSPVRGWQSHQGVGMGGRAPPPASPEAKCFAFYNLLTLLPLNCHINK